MKAARLHGPRDLRVESVREPRPEPGEAIVRITAAGLCGTDYEIWSGARPVAYPRVMGHELVGRVEAVAPDVTRVAPGDPVVVEPNYSCGRCPLWRAGRRRGSRRRPPGAGPWRRPAGFRARRRGSGRRDRRHARGGLARARAGSARRPHRTHRAASRAHVGVVLLGRTPRGHLDGL